MTTPLDTTFLGTFNYASLSSLMIFWRASPAAVAPLVAGTGLEPALFDGQALVNLNFERYAGVGPNYFSSVIETEFSVIVQPVQSPLIVPTLTLDQYLSGADMTKAFGNFRVNVPCADATAVQAGSQQYGEIKFLTGFNYQVPNVNASTILDWWIRCRDPKTPTVDDPYIFDLHANFQGTRPQVSNFSPVSAYANLKKADGPHIVVSQRNVFGPFQRWTPGADDVQLQIGTSDHPMVAQMKSVFTGAPPVAILLFESSPAATSSHALVTTPVAVAGV
jgi:hypothetical protein